MTRFQKGQRVHVEFDGEVYTTPTPNGVYVKSGTGMIRHVHADDCTLLDPQDWPPQPGDIWELDGEEYFARISQSFPGKTICVGSERGRSYVFPGASGDEFKSLNPKLIRRREAQK